MSTVFTEPTTLSDLLKYEASNLYSRDTVTVLLGQHLPLGAVVGIVTVTGKVKAIDPAASDGSQIAAGVLLQGSDATAFDVRSVMVARHALVSDQALVFPVGLTAGEKNTALHQLKAAGIVPRQGV
jgi:hypothetical protein